jgi:hypothetical protein
MPFSSGTYTIPSNSFGVPVTGTTISSTAATAVWTDLATALSTAVLKDGSQTITANIPMAGFVFTGLGSGDAAGESVRFEQVLSANGLKLSVGAALTATGADQAGALQLASAVNQVTTVAASTGVKLYASPVAGDVQVVYNGGANALTVYPQTSGTINALAANSGMQLGTNTVVMFFAVTTTAWIGILSR